MGSQYIMALDQGTTSSRCIIYNSKGEIVSKAQKEFEQIYPQPGWIEHNPMEIWSSQLSVATEAMHLAGLTYSDIAGIGITNQRETTVIWDKNTGKPIYNAIVWQCRRTSERIDRMKQDGICDIVRKKTGLVPDAYFSASKIEWILDNVDNARERANRGELLFGTVDTWLVWNLTKGKVHITDYTNASRTMLYDIHNLCWDDELLEYFNIPRHSKKIFICKHVDSRYINLISTFIRYTIGNLINVYKNMPTKDKKEISHYLKKKMNMTLMPYMSWLTFFKIKIGYILD